MGLQAELLTYFFTDQLLHCYICNQSALVLVAFCGKEHACGRKGSTWTRRIAALQAALDRAGMS